MIEKLVPSEIWTGDLPISEQVFDTPQVVNCFKVESDFTSQLI